MPYILKKVKDGFKVCKKDNPKECYSKKGLPLERAKKQMQAIGISEAKQGKGLLEGDAKPLTARLGGKVLLKKQIVDKFFPEQDTYTTYVEPFVGGGSIYFYKENKEPFIHKEVINDIDPDIYTIFKGFQKYKASEIASEVNGNYTKKDFEKIKEFEPKTDFDKFIKTFLISRLSYFARGKTFGKPRINSTFEGYQERLKDVIILNEDYKKVIKKYDSKNTFFYLDPPYKESQSDFYYPAINLKELQDIIGKIKGKFLLSFPDIKEAKDIFKDKYNIFEIKTKYTGRRQQGGQTIPAKEILIANYEPKMQGGSKPLDQELYDKVKAEIYKKNPKHSLFRSAQISKEYKRRGGKWDTKKKPEFGIRKWFNQNWITLNDYYHDDKIVPCGSSDTYEKYDEYPLCRPLKIAKDLGKEKIGKMLKKKKGPKQLRTEEVLGTDKYNIKPTMTGKGIPSSDLLHRMQKGTYINDGPAEKRVGDYQLIETTPTMNLYNTSNKYVVAIRGTTFSEADDVAADLLIPFDELKKAPRFKKDLATLKKWKAKYGPGEWYGVGHSLGGAILDEFLLMGLLDEGVSYNPAVSYANTQKDIKNRRIYKSGDPLYNVMGRFTKNPEVRQSTEPYDGFINRGEHSIKQFEGGRDALHPKLGSGSPGNMKKFHNQLKKAGLTHELYMKAVKKLTKESGYDPDKVEMSDDGVHKLVYHSPEGLKRFGRVGYGDYIIWSFKEAKGKVPEGYAAKKRNTFRKSHGKISKIHNLGKYSENELAINLLW